MSETGALILEIVVISASLALVIGLLSRYIYRRIKGLPVGECECCHKGSKKLLKEYHKLYSNK